MRLCFQLSAQVACRYAVLSRYAPSAAARRHATCARRSFQLPTGAGSAGYAESAMAPVTSMLGLVMGSHVLAKALYLFITCLCIYILAYVLCVRKAVDLAMTTTGMCIPFIRVEYGPTWFNDAGHAVFSLAYRVDSSFIRQRYWQSQ